MLRHFILTLLLALGTFQFSMPAFANESASAKLCQDVVEPDSDLAQIRKFFTAYEKYLTYELEHWKKDGERESIHSDPLACRFCSVSSAFIVEDLKEAFPQFSWYVVRTQEPYQNYYHDYVYSPSLKLMIDATYRQFLIGTTPEDFQTLPRIFVGTTDEFKSLVGTRMPYAVLRKYVEYTQIIWPFPFERKGNLEFAATGTTLEVIPSSTLQQAHAPLKREQAQIKANQDLNVIEFTKKRSLFVKAIHKVRKAVFGF